MGDDERDERDERDEKLERMRLQIERNNHHIDMLLATALLTIIRSIEAGNIEAALETLRLMHDHWRQKADR